MQISAVVSCQVTSHIPQLSRRLNLLILHAGALQIENSEESDQGKYECVAMNSAGTRYSSPANLYVRGKVKRPSKYHIFGFSYLHVADFFFFFYTPCMLISPSVFKILLNCDFITLISGCRAPLWGVSGVHGQFLTVTCT